MLRSKKALAGVSIALAAVAAQAQTYGEVGLVAGGHEKDMAGATRKSSPNALRAVVGREVSDKLAVEGLLGLGLGRASEKVAGVKIPGAELKWDTILGVYLKGKVNVASGLDAFARAGLVRAEATETVSGAKTSSRDSGFSYGFGVSYGLNKSTSLNFDYTSYLDKSAVKTTGFTLGVGYKF